MRNSKLQSAQETSLASMYASHLSGPRIYHASKFWDKLSNLNLQWLRDDGLENFKRTVNNNYFNWMVDLKSSYFRAMAGNYFKSRRRVPGRIWKVMRANIGPMWYRTYLSHSNRGSWLQHRLYVLYVLALDQYVSESDEYGLYGALSEPLIGNPLSFMVDGRMISQDLANSYLEYIFIRKLAAKELSKPCVIAEIGAGYGRLSYLLHLLKHEWPCKLILIDLPPALLVSQWYLHTTFPSANFMNYRDFSSFDEVREEFEAADICFLLPHQIELIPDKSIDLMINISSLQEMSREQINHYYELIDQKARYFYTKQWLFWENPEDQLHVPAIIYPTKTHWELCNARVNPVHREFFEAIFKI